jgi:hypothetical protein
MKRLLMTVALTCLLSVSALAGDIPCGAPAPVPGDTPSVGVAATIVLTLVSLIR